MSTGYTGHGRSGGIQQHSKGDMFPYTVQAVGDPNRVLEWQALDMRSGSTGPRRATYKLAQLDVHSAQIRNMMHH